MPVWLTGTVIKYGLISLLSVGLLWKVGGFVSGYINETRDTKTKLSNERILRERTDVELEALRATIELQDKHRAALTAIRNDHRLEIDSIRTKANDQMKVLEDRARFERVVMAKPGLVESLANKSTKKVFDNLENIINQ